MNDREATFEVIGEISRIETITSGRGVRVKRSLERAYGKGRWRKMKGKALVRSRGPRASRLV